MKNRRKFIVASLLILVITPFVLFTLNQQAQNKTKQIKEKDSFPVVDYTNQEFVDEKRKAKSEKYNKASIPLPPNLPEDSDSVLFSDWDIGLTALPIEKSEVVILGRVIDAKAHLSNNKASVYSEFKIEIERVFKNDSQQEFEDGKYLRAERPGGIVRYPSGAKLWFRVAGQEMPRVNQRYVFFLTNNFQRYGHHKQDLNILTAYELREGRVFPLDNPSNSHPIVSTYIGKEESVLLNDLQNALNSH